MAVALAGCRPHPNSHFGAPMDPNINDPAYQDDVSLICVLRVGGVQVPFFTKIGLAAGDKDGAMGMAVYYPYTHVLIDAGLDNQTRAQTIFHELLHVISDSYGPSLKEPQVLCLEMAFTQLLQDNLSDMNRIFTDMANPSLAAPVHELLEARVQEAQAAKVTPALDDRGVNLN